jgi:hypothetical protein
MEQPQLVIDEIQQVVEAVRSGSHQVARNKTEALMANGDEGTGETFIPVIKALQPVVEPLAVPSEKCAP